MKNYALDTKEIKKHFNKAQEVMKERDLDALYISSYDTFLNEYVPLVECHRYYFTGFTGSTAELLILRDGKAHLFVDGRYHEQAHKEVDANLCQVEECAFGYDIPNAMKELIKVKKVKKVGVESSRVPLAFYNDILSSLEVTELCSVSEYKEFVFTEKAEALEEGLGLKGYKDKISQFVNKGEGYFVSALDSLSWLTNIRAYQLPNQSSFAASAICLDNEVHFFVSDLEMVSSNLLDRSDFFFYSNDQKEEVLSELKNLNRVFFESSATSLLDYNLLRKTFGENVIDRNGELVGAHSVKTKAEMKLIYKAFDLGDTAIYNTLKWLEGKYDEEISEIEVNQYLGKCYENEGSKEQSFKTISGFGANGSIIHYSTPSEVKAKKGELILLDSGGYFEGGFATDTTRTVLYGDIPCEKSVLIYTLVLKGLLQAENAVFPSGTIGAQIDSLARFSMRSKGLDYAHGTGHGVGINVHEGGFRLAPNSTIPLVEGKIGSIEPGIYLPGFGGVRLENIVEVVKHPTLEGMLCFKPLVYIGYDHRLIDKSLLTEDELMWLNDYESECKERGRSFI